MLSETPDHPAALSRDHLASLHEQLENLKSERRKYASGIYRIPRERLEMILSRIDLEIEVVQAGLMPAEMHEED